MREEYEAIAGAGIVLQLDSPDLAADYHVGFQDLTESEFLKQAEQQGEVLNHALANVPAASARLHGATTSLATREGQRWVRPRVRPRRHDDTARRRRSDN